MSERREGGGGGGGGREERRIRKRVRENRMDDKTDE